jgi:hypothetical protein
MAVVQASRHSPRSAAFKPSTIFNTSNASSLSDINVCERGAQCDADSLSKAV